MVRYAISGDQMTWDFIVFGLHTVRYALSLGLKSKVLILSSGFLLLMDHLPSVISRLVIWGA